MRATLRWFSLVAFTEGIGKIKPVSVLAVLQHSNKNSSFESHSRHEGCLHFRVVPCREGLAMLLAPIWGVLPKLEVAFLKLVFPGVE